jgi:bla regulator protein BlaR1
MQPEARPILFALLLLHVAGTGFALLRLALEVRRLRGIRARAVPQGGRWLLSDEVRAPMTVGILRPAILLPSSLPGALTDRELEDVIAHESEHVRRRDVLRNMIQELVIAVWWFHPLVHRLARESRAIREECCDDALLASGRCEKAQYARTLLQAATFAAHEGRTVAAIAESPHELLRRVRRIADRQFVPSRRLGILATLAILLFALTLLPGLRISAGNRFAFDHATRHALHHRH